MNTRYGAGDRTRTGTLSPAVDFESTTSTIPSHRQVCSNSILHSFQNSKKKVYILPDFKLFTFFTISYIMLTKNTAQEVPYFEEETILGSGHFLFPDFSDQRRLCH